MKQLLFGLRILTGLLLLGSLLQADPKPGLTSFTKEYCLKCHQGEKAKADFDLHKINPNISQGKDIVKWEKILELLSIGDMPPKKAKQPPEGLKRVVVEHLKKELQKIGRGPSTESSAFPHHGNRVNHEALFSGEHKGPSYTTSRLWRISPQIYRRFAASVGMARKLNAPLRQVEGETFKDYSLLFADETTIKTHIQNCKRIATTLIHGQIDSRRNRSSKKVFKQGGRRGSSHKVIAEFASAKSPPNEEEMEELVDYLFKFLLQRQATSEDYKRYIDGFLKPNLPIAGREEALKGTLTAIMMSPEFLFRTELGLGEELPDGRRKLSARETAYALSFTLFDYAEKSLLQAVDKGKLKSKEDIAREFRRVYEGKDRTVRSAVGQKIWMVGKGAGIMDVKLMDASHPKLLRFFREFFGYPKLVHVFKDDSRHDGKHDPWGLIRDADWLVLNALREDRQVFNKILTSNEFFIQSRNRKPIKDARPYNLDSPEEPVEGNPIALPKEQRAGMLTHPAWLAAHSGNFENDPVRRGKWIQERLLAGVVPDIPIGVEAQLPETPEQTLKQRFKVVEKETCWRCHKKMNPLGDPFEAYDDFGRFRKHHFVDQKGHVIATEFEAFSRLRKIAWRDSHRKNHPPEEFTHKNVETKGYLIGTGNPKLDGEVSGPIDLVHRLAQSTRVRQSIIRHVFRFWMGRNETLEDSPTLMAMDNAYLESDGSFKELLISLVTSDSFLYRK